LSDSRDDPLSVQLRVELCAVDGLAIEAEGFILHAGARREKRSSLGESGNNILVADLNLKTLAERGEHGVLFSFGCQVEPMGPDLSEAVVRDHLTAHRSGHGLKPPARSERGLGRFV